MNNPKEDNLLNEKLNNISFLSEEDIKNANFYELAIYLQEMNSVETLLEEIEEEKDENTGEIYG